MRHGLDDAVPAEMPRSNLDDEIFEIIRFEELYRHAAFTGTHADRQAAFLIEITDGKRHGFPGTRRECADGHIGENQRINPVDRRRMFRLDKLAILYRERQFLG